MRFIKYSVFFSARLVIVFLLTAFVQPEVQYEASIIVTASRPQAYQFFTDSRLAHQWISGLEKIESPHAQLYRRGNINTLYLSGFGSSYVIKQTIRGVRRNQSLSFILESKSSINTVNVHFFPLANNTQIKIRGTIQGKNKIWQSLFFYTRLWHQKRLERDLHKFEQLVKNSSTSLSRLNNN